MNPILTMSLPFLGISYFPFPHTLAKSSVAGVQVQSAEAQDACSPGSGSREQLQGGPLLVSAHTLLAFYIQSWEQTNKTFLGSIFCSCGGKRSL